MKKADNKPRTILRKINSKMVRGKKEEQGLILIELLMAMAIFGIGVATIFTLFVSATQGVIIGLEKTKGSLLSTEALEAALSVSKSDQDYLTPGKYEFGISSNDQWVLIPKTGLMGHFLLANSAKDSSIYKNHGIARQIAFFEDRKGQPLAAAVFNGTDSYVKTEYAFSLQVEGPLTLAAWVSDTGPELTPTPRTIAGKYDVSKGEGGYMLYKEGDNYHFLISGQGGTASISAPSENFPWEHVAGVYDPGNQTLRLYINGKLITESETTGFTSLNKIPEIEFFIGNDASNSNPWHGRISDVRVYNRSLTANEISGLYDSYSAPYEKGLIVSNIENLAGIWSFNEGEGCVIHDNSGNNNHGLIKNCFSSQWTENRYEKEKRAFYFENNNYIEIADSPALQIKEGISLSLWIKMPEELPSENMTIFHKRAAGFDDYSFSLTYNNEEKTFGWAASVGAPDQIGQNLTTGLALPGKWQHVIVTFDGTDKKIYINNYEISGSNEITVANDGTNSHLFIGRNAADQGYLAETVIDDLRTYNKILTPTERQAIFLNNINYYLE